MENINELTIEENFAKLNEIIEKMQSNELSLEDSFKMYKDGLQLVESCNSKIEKIQCDIQKLNAAEDNND